MSTLVPMVIEQGDRAERAYDIYSLLLKKRIVMLASPINEPVANLMIAQLLYLDHEDRDQQVQVYVQSPGGEVYAGLAIYDTMQQMHAPVSTVAVGRAASFGTVILTAGRKGLRYALPSATIHMHQPLGGAQGQVSDMLIQINEYTRLRTYLNEIFVYHTGQDRAVIERDTDRDIYLTAQQAVEYGLIDGVLGSARLPVPIPGYVLPIRAPA
ncbi:MAG: ATP-dependent Clp protease proteolytic subunit [Anaerolineae bacterium]|nr:ATP-dependent Clp protease proteolytic subunit [Anaerolineae bacterium]